MNEYIREERWCKNCDEQVVYLRIPRTDNHVADYRCPRCNMHLGFEGKLENASSKRRPAGHRELVAKYGNGICEMCLRTTSQVKPGFLNAHHVIAFADGGTNDRSNVWIVCDQCHLVIHTARKYVGTHRDDENEA